MAKLIDAIHILCGETISENEWKEADVLLQSFVEDFEVLYGELSMVYNVHQLKHLAECVRRNGPLSVYSNYPMEDYIGHLVSFVKGTTDVTAQIGSRYILEKNLHSHLEKSELARKFYDKIESKLSFTIVTKVNESLVIGKPRITSNLSPQEKSLIQNTLQTSENMQINEYRSTLLNSSIFYEITENASKKRTNDSFIYDLETRSFVVIIAIITVNEQLYF